jgi:hypothetical protein
MAGSIREALTRAITREPREYREVPQQLKESTVTNEPISTIKTQVVTITPALANAWLVHNTHNRPMSEGVVKKYAAIMSAGQWQLNGEAIIFASDGSLMSGQHRLKACALAGKNFQSLVTTGVERSTFATIDTHRRRGVADVLSIEGVKCAHRVASVARLYLHIRDGNMASRCVANEAYIELVAAHPAIAKWGGMLRKQDKQFKSYVFSALAHVDEIYGHDMAQGIYDKLVDGVGLSDGDPELVLRNRLLLNKVTEDEGVALTIKAFNYSLEGKRVKNIQYRPSDEATKLLGL